MRKSIAMATIATLALSGPVMAGDFSYDTLELGFTGESIDDPGGDEGLDGSGITLGGTWAFSPGVFGFASLSGTEYEYRQLVDEDFKTGQLQLGLGFNVPLTEQLDLVSGVSVQRLRLEDQFLNTLNEDGYGLKVGLRGLAGRRFEWTAAVNYVDFGRGIDDTSWSAGFRYYFTRLFAVGVDVGSTDKNQMSGTLGFRWDFGNRR
jgi:outer membrane protein assembly factor BamA